jgi:23S rRNA-/tRNA-specific pseudouridylate synthase
MAVFDPDDHADEVDFDDDDEDGNESDDDEEDDSPRRNKKSKSSSSSTTSSSSPYTNRRRKKIPAVDDDFVDDDDDDDSDDEDDDRPQRKKKSKSKSSLSSSSSSESSSLLRPAEVIYQDPHLLVVNKPPGYHCGPNHNRNDRIKCILNHLLLRKLGGGQHGRRVLRPLHRIDQPCSGVLLLGRSSRVGPKLQPIWTLVRKTYVVVVTPTAAPGWACMKLALSSESQRKYWRRLIGTMAGKNATKLKGGGWSVHMIPGMVAGKGRTVQLDWTLIGPDVPPTTDAVASSSDQPMDQNHLLLDGTRFVLLIRTTQGARHMVRALLSAYGLAIVGDTRYNRANGPRTTADGSSGSNSIGGRNLHGEGIYYDRSWPFVALHARAVTLPSVFELPGNRGIDVDGTVMTPQARTFTATLPPDWHDHFHLREEYLATVEKEAAQYPYDVKAERVGGGGRGMKDELDEWMNLP